MSGKPYAPCIAAIEALWAARWPAPAGVPVLWHHNSADDVPSRRDTSYWLHVAVEFSGERIVAFGGGPSANEWELDGVVAIRCFAARGLGEATQLAHLDDALGVFRAQRVPPLSIIGEAVLREPGASDDGGWWVRSGIAAFVYRFRA